MRSLSPSAISGWSSAKRRTRLTSSPAGDRVLAAAMADGAGTERRQLRLAHLLGPQLNLRGIPLGAAHPGQELAVRGDGQVAHVVRTLVSAAALQRARAGPGAEVVPGQLCPGAFRGRVRFPGAVRHGGFFLARL